MKKLISIVVIIIFLFSLTSCFNGGISKPKTGGKVEEITLTTKSGERVTINKNTDPVYLYKLIEELYEDDYCYEYYGKFIKQFNEHINNTYKGLLIANDFYTHYTFKNDFFRLKHYSYYEQSNNGVYIDMVKNKPLYGSAKYNNTRYLFLNDGNEVRSYPPSIIEMSENDNEKLCLYITYGNAWQSSIVAEGVLGGFYIEEFVDKFTYDFTLTENYIIFKVQQPIGVIFNHGMTLAISDKEGSFKKEIYFNIETNKIDYVKTKANVYNHFTGRDQFKYNYVLSRVDKSVFDAELEFLKQYTKENTVEYSKLYK